MMNQEHTSILDRESTTPVSADRIRVMLLVSSLEEGGAERQVVQLANSLPRDRFEVIICSLSSRVPLAAGLADPDCLHVVQKRWRFDASTIWRVARLLRQHDIHVVHAFLFDAEMTARLAGKLAGTVVVVASERNADYKRPRLHTCAHRITSGMFDGMIANSHAGRQFNINTLSISPDRIDVVHNGVDTTRFAPSDTVSARQSLGIATEPYVIGMVASLIPKKNHLMLLRVAEEVRTHIPDVLFICVGDSVQAEGGGNMITRSGARIHHASMAYREQVMQALDDMGLRDTCLFLGKRQDMCNVYNACDITVLTSRHEGTPNVLLESMACGVPAVVTNVSDNARIVADGQAGYVVDVDDVQAMAGYILSFLRDADMRTAVGQSARRRAEMEYSIEALGRRTGDIYTKLLERKMNRQASR